MSYPTGTLRALLATDAVTPPTREVLQARLEAAPAPPRFFSEEEMQILRAACARLIPQPERATPIELATPIDARLAEGTGNGWRYDALPPDGETYRAALRGLNQSARVLANADFTDLDASQQDAILSAVQNGEAKGEVWQTLDAPRFFEELLAEVTETYYAHPLAQEEIGCVASADAPGWTQIALNEREPREPQEIGDAQSTLK